MRLDVLHLSYEPDDERCGDCSKEQLEAMDARFVAALERAFECGLESRASAASKVALPVSRGPRLSAPLCPAIWSGLAAAMGAQWAIVVGEVVSRTVFCPGHSDSAHQGQL